MTSLVFELVSGPSHIIPAIRANVSLKMQKCDLKLIIQERYMKKKIHNQQSFDNFIHPIFITAESWMIHSPAHTCDGIHVTFGIFY